MAMIRKESAARIKSSEGNKVDAIVSTAAVDRDREIILPSAYIKRLELYRRNPIHIWMHDPSEMENYLGKAVQVEVTSEGLRAVFEYATEANPKAAQALALVKQGVLNCFSVGFYPHGWVRASEVEKLSDVQKNELRGIDLQGVSRIYTDVELREISLVGIPSNTGAFVVGRAAEESFEPPKNVQEAASLGLQLREEFNRGGTEIGVARARDLSNGRSISLDTIGRMVSYFARHAVDAQAEGWEDRSNPSAGWIAWLLWGGDPGKRWAERIWSAREEEKAMDIDRHDISARLHALADAVLLCEYTEENPADMVEHLNQALRILSSVANEFQAVVQAEVEEDSREEEPLPEVQPAAIPEPLPVPQEPPSEYSPEDDMQARNAKEGRSLSSANIAEFEAAHQDLMKAAERISMVLEACRPKPQERAASLAEKRLEELTFDDIDIIFEMFSAKNAEQTKGDKI